MKQKMKRILIVDDEPNIVMTLDYALQKNGFKVFIARNGFEALEIADKEIPDLVLMDVMMPIMDGYEATTQIRKNVAFKELPIISLTAKAMPEDKAKSLEAGANDYLTKPVDIDKLLNMMRLWLHK